MREVSFSSPVLSARKVIPARFPCASKIWLPLHWGALPPDTGELVLYVGGLGAPRAVATGRRFTPFTGISVIVGLKATLRRLSVGGLPRGAVGVDEKGLPACPATLAGQRFVFTLFAIPRSRALLPHLTGRTQSSILSKARADATGVGTFTATYGA